MGSLDEYLASLDEPRRAAFERVRRAAEKTAGATEQGTSYGMAALMYGGRPLLCFLAARKHLSVFPCSGAVVEQAADLLEGFDVSKGTVRFTEEHVLPDKAVRSIVKARMKEIDSGRR
jgi:uncharacterized protein YdhG (YjbR/CyaY superfamily)